MHWREGKTNQDEAPQVDSPSIAGDWQGAADWTAEATDDQDGAHGTALPLRAGRLMTPKAARLRPRSRRRSRLTTACAAMGALVLALVIWRAEMVRLLPQTAAFYKLVGLDVNLRGLRFRDVKVSSETVEGKSMLVIEGAITDESNKPVELPRLRFSIRDAQGAEIYAWNTVLEQSLLDPARRPCSSRGLPRRLPAGAMSMYASSTSGTSPAAVT